MPLYALPAPVTPHAIIAATTSRATALTHADRRVAAAATALGAIGTVTLLALWMAGEGRWAQALALSAAVVGGVVGTVRAYAGE